MSSRPAPGTPEHDEWVDTQAARGMAFDDEARFEHELGRMTPDEAITLTVCAELSDAVRHALRWVDTPAVLRLVADEIAAFDHRQADGDDVPF